jgi:hypothetical protein
VAGSRGARILEIGGKTERLSGPAAGSAFLGRFSSINETVSGFGAGGAGVSSCFAGTASFAFGLMLGGPVSFLAVLSSDTGLVSPAGFLVFGDIRSVVLRAALLLAAGSGLAPGFGEESLRVLARVTMNDLSL